MANTAPLIVDLSHHNEVYDFDDMRAAGCIGVIHKATEGKSYSDAEFWIRRDEAQEAGLEWASYHFLKHGDVDLQMQNFLNKVQPQIGERLVIDFEDEACTLDDLREAISILQDLAPLCELTVYSGHLLKEQLGGAHDSLLAQTSLWIAQYTTAAAPEWPKGTWPVWSLWQYTDCGSCPGVKGPVDANRFNGSIDQAYLWFNPEYDSGTPPVPPTPPEPAADVVRIDISAPEGVSVAVFVNGEPLA